MRNYAALLLHSLTRALVATVGGDLKDPAAARPDVEPGPASQVYREAIRNRIGVG
jgi:hypothetical protein